MLKGVLIALILCVPSNSWSYSVLAHESLVDEAWRSQLAPMLRSRFPRSTTEDIARARAYAYGGSLIQDLGYYPFGSRFFSNLVHYVRSGDFIAALLRHSTTVNEYAFALGALAHYASDNVAHPTAVNRAVPLMYPKVGAKYGPEVVYGASPTRHVMVEFAFDVLQAARGRFTADTYQQLIGFEVASSLLDRAFRDTYGLTLNDVFGDVDLAVGTYRRAASEIIPDITRLAWREKRDEILEALPGTTERDFVFTMTRNEYEQVYGTKYRKPGLLARVVVAIFKVIPKFGPFKPLAFEPLTPETEQLLVASLLSSRRRYGELLDMVRQGRVSFGDTDLDTGRRPTRGINPLADETYAELLSRLSKDEDATIAPDVRRALNGHYGD